MYEEYSMRPESGLPTNKLSFLQERTLNSYQFKSEYKD
jgi:hypothetical protein